MEKEFEKLSLKDQILENFFDLEKDFIEIEVVNSTRQANLWDKNSEKFTIFLPTFEKLCEFIEADPTCKIDKDLFAKHYNSKEKMFLLPVVSNIFYENFLLEVLGILNTKNSLDEKKLENLDFINEEKKIYFLEGENSFLNYILRNIETLKENLKPNDTPKLRALLDQIGIFIEKNIFDMIENKILNEKKILIIVAAGNNFWFKSDKSMIGKNITYSVKLNNYNYLYMNWELIEKFFLRISQHPRCSVGIITSMIKKNLDNAFFALDRGEYKTNLSIKVDYLFDQEANEVIFTEDAKGGKTFKRSLQKIEEKTKKYFNDTNVLFIESELDKSENIKDNMIYLDGFDEEFILGNKEHKEKLNRLTDNLFNYLEKLLDECDCDIREYLMKNPFKSK